MDWDLVTTKGEEESKSKREERKQSPKMTVDRVGNDSVRRKTETRRSLYTNSGHPPAEGSSGASTSLVTSPRSGRSNQNQKPHGRLIIVRIIILLNSLFGWSQGASQPQILQRSPGIEPTRLNVRRDVYFVFCWKYWPRANSQYVCVYVCMYA